MKTIVLILLAALSNLSARADQRSHEAAQGGLILAGLLRELAVCEIKEFSVSEVTLKDALEKAFATAGADLKYLKGYRLDTEMEDRNVTPLKGVEFGVLLTQIAYQASVQVREAEGVLHFKKLEITEPSVVAIPLKREAAEKLGLTGTAGTKEALKEIGVQVSRCSFSTERRVLIIEAYNEEIEKRRWIVKLIEMGYSVSLG